jgi:hypothetical protein
MRVRTSVSLGRERDHWAHIVPGLHLVSLGDNPAQASLARREGAQARVFAAVAALMSGGGRNRSRFLEATKKGLQREISLESTGRKYWQSS